MNTELKRIENEQGFRFYQTPEGKLYPSITTVLGYRKKEKLKGWVEKVGADEAERVSKRSNQKGTEIHELIYKYLIDKENLIETKYPALFEVLKPVLDLMEPEYMEISLWSDTLKVAGTVDFIGLFNKKPHIIDFKTFSVDGGEYDFDILNDYYLQVIAYSVMALERFDKKIQNLKILKINPWKYCECVHEYDITFNKQLLNMLLLRIKDFYKNVVVAPQ
ncbi:MAG: hypothetical protein N3A54_00830 [Patescibacteria group bacterium]|nr:hypothetical protein [Patescibacteria group bacterium]